MKRRLLFGLIILFVCGTSLVFSQPIPGNLQNNRYYLESVRLTKLAQESYEYGDYDASANYAAEALRYAQLSDEYVALQLKIRETEDAITAAKSRIDWADSIGVSQTYPDEYGVAEQAYSEALSFRQGEEWDEAIAAAYRAVDALAFVSGAPVLVGGKPELPARYTVRPWAVSRDCLWNIAGRPWAYGDPHKWRLIYNANKAKFPNPDNPNVIEPGMVLDIPSLQGERREGTWDPNKAYEPIR
ncbi:treponemal membrane protein B (Antigen TmpB) [Treponema primitia ZAS-2]|uniref:Treponemal membrane protein B (Antigen TmpB) n=1 Tax=Treponema primitia (strain ATCC BAA-887 / DSM 12427 / ZAS-2) TaxID=545694 RepID=F5YKP1_TREPZ|nr:LysM peptidoglycan-binding domain-containing protein [Treponema primitia]AEF83653.1 treponemal membrane protein B (Antigen TmpB) [Treponema primitia ZAS-2]